VTEQLLDDADIGSRFKQVRGKTVAQRVDAGALGDAGRIAGIFEDLLHGALGDAASHGLAFKEPLRGFISAQVGLDEIDNFGREKSGSVLLSLRLADGDDSALEVEVRDLERSRLADTKSRRIGEREHQPVLDIQLGCNKPFDLVSAEHDRQLFLFLRAFDLIYKFLAEDPSVVEAQRVHRAVERRPGDPFTLGEMVKILLDIILDNPVGRLTGEAEKFLVIVGVHLAGAMAVASDAHLARDQLPGRGGSFNDVLLKAVGYHKAGLHRVGNKPELVLEIPPPAGNCANLVNDRMHAGNPQSNRLLHLIHRQNHPEREITHLPAVNGGLADARRRLSPEGIQRESAPEPADKTGSTGSAATIAGRKKSWCADRIGKGTGRE